MCANCKCPRENHDMSFDVELEAVDFKVRALDISFDINKKDNLPAPPPVRQSYNDYPTVKVTDTETTPVDNDFLPPPPPISVASDYIWSPAGLTPGQVRENFVTFCFSLFSCWRTNGLLRASLCSLRLKRKGD